MSKQKRLVGKRKEASLAVVGSNEVVDKQPYNKIFTPVDAEYQRYSELLKGFFQKLTRWKEILAADEYQDEREWVLNPLTLIAIPLSPWSRYSVFRSDNGLYILPGASMAKNDPPEKVLQVSNNTYLDDPEHGLFGDRFFIRPGPAGRHVLVDPEDGKTLEEVTIEVSDQTGLPWGSQRIDIKTEREGKAPEGRRSYRAAYYNFQGGSLNVSHNYLGYGLMTDEMATSLINSIDRFIPKTASPTPQNERRTSQEKPAPPALP